MARVICHWTAGRHRANGLDRQHYHILIEGDGRLVRGVPTIDLNAEPVKPGYAAHTRNCNGGSIGVALCGMVGAREDRDRLLPQRLPQVAVRHRGRIEPPDDQVDLARRALAALIVAFALIWFAGIDQRTLMHPDEGRYAEIAREMAANPVN